MAFEIESGIFGDYEIIKVHNQKLGHELIFLPDKGALPIKLQFHNIEFVEPIDSPEKLQNDHWFRNFWLMPYPNRTNAGSFNFLGKNYQLEMSKHDPRHALHGFFYKLWAEDILVNNNRDTVELTIKHMYHADQTGYPFPFDTEITYTIHEKGRLEIHIEVINTGESTMPFGIGWHPYFRFDEPLDSLKVKISPLEHIILDDKSIPTGVTKEFEKSDEISRLELDDSFKYLETPYQMCVEGKAAKLTIEQSEGLEYLQLFTPGRNSIAIEPMSCGVDALNNGDGIVQIRPAEKKQYDISVELEKL